jgi:hypothetical protein
VTLAIGKHNEDTIRGIGRRAEQLRALLEDGADARAAFAGEIRVQPVEIHPNGSTIHRERGQDIAPAGECYESKPIALEVLDQAASLTRRTLKPARRHVLGQHGAADIYGKYQTQGARLGRDLGPTGAWAGEADDGEQ